MMAGKETRRPAKIKPMLAYLFDEPFDDADWLFETKWDGFRAIADISHQTVELYSRTFQSFNQRFHPIVKALQEMEIDAILDGEIVILDRNGVSNFQALQNYHRSKQEGLHYFVFDLLYLDGQDLRDRPLIDRKKMLQQILPEGSRGVVRCSKHVLTKGKSFFADAAKKKLEGMIAKEIQSSYVSHRSRAWLKIKTHARQEVIVCGFTSPKGSRKHFGALIAGIYENKNLRYAGHVGGGFNEKSLASLKAKLEPLVTSKCPFKVVPLTNDKAT
ncbi:MAG: non-homologous end-joining DNA ligase, partial [Parachlamydia sp.]|nr:non-homologous end-joining DNA ligase [Parachlamydia sp.]